jgi:hypothetical protein
MAVTRLERKGQRNVAKAKARVKRIKFLSQRPVIKNVDVEAIKAEFAANVAKAEKKVEAKAEVAVVEVEAPAKEKAPKAEKKVAAKKPAAEKKPAAKKAPAKKKAE